MLLQKKNQEQTNGYRRELEVVSPPVNIFESETEVILEAEMTGLPKEGVNVDVNGDELLITGRPSEHEVPKDYTVVYRERNPFEYRRTFQLSSEIQKDKIKAKYENGILTVTLFKVEKPKPRRIAIE